MLLYEVMLLVALKLAWSLVDDSWDKSAGFCFIEA
jgi:hypothetical protein